MVTEICLRTPNNCSKFQLDWSTCLRDFCKVCKKKEKNKKKNSSLIACILGMGERILLGTWLPLSEGHHHSKFGAIRIRHHGASYA